MARTASHANILRIVASQDGARQDTDGDFCRISWNSRRKSTEMHHKRALVHTTEACRALSLFGNLSGSEIRQTCF